MSLSILQKIKSQKGGKKQSSAVYCLVYVVLYRFSSRILIENKRTRQLLATYAKRGMSTIEMEEMMREINLHAPFLTDLLRMVDKESNTFHCCPPKWKKFMQSLSSSSPVCALIPPSSLDLIQEMCEKDITSQPDVCAPFLCELCIIHCCFYIHFVDT